MNRSFEYVSVLEYRLKAANDRIKAFESGERYTQQQAKHHQILRAQELQIKKLVAELTQAHRDIITIRNQWFEVFEDFQKTSDKKEATFIKEIQLLHEKLIKAEGQRDAALDKVTELRKELYEVKIELEDEKGKNIKLTAQINRDYENSSLSSSKSIKNKKIINSREKQEENREDNLVTMGIAEKSKYLPWPLFCFLRLKKFLKIRILKRLQKQSSNSILAFGLNLTLSSTMPMSIIIQKQVNEFMLNFRQGLLMM